MRVGFPLTVNSGYRDPAHPVEAKKEKPGAHAQGRAVDLAWPAGGAAKRKLIETAFDMGFAGIGIEGRFLHLDNGNDNAPRPSFWTYF